mgnify:FL=1
MQVKELRERLEQFGDYEDVWVYEPTDEGEPYQGIDCIERGPFGDITIYRKMEGMK